jgi:cytochrome c biogenesis protein CcmG/thiol:disulfide interchange protein DsbE
LKSLKFLVPLALFLVLLVFLGAGLQLNPREVPSPLIGKAAPGFALTRLDDPSRVVKREELLGQVWMLNVWASWCTPCREEHPLLVELGKRKLVPIYGLNYKDTRPQAQGFLAQLGNPYEASLFDSDGRVGIDFGVYGVPETFIIDREGVIRLKHIGALTPEVLRTRIEPLLRQLNG